MTTATPEEVARRSGTRVAIEYALAIALIALVTLVRWQLDPLLGLRSPFVFYLPALIATALFCGLGAAVLSAVLALVLANYVLEPFGALVPHTKADWVEFVVWCLAAACVLAIGRRARALVLEARMSAERARRAERRSEELSRQLGERVAELQLILDSIPVGVVLARDPECNRVETNRWLRDVLEQADGLTVAPSAQAAPPYSFWQGDRELPATDLPIQRAATSGRTVPDIELELRWRDGRAREFLTGAQPMLDEEGRVRGALSTCVDITDLKRMQRVLEDKARTLEATNADMERFAATAAHDLKSPLHTVSTFLQLLERDSSRLDPQERKRLVGFAVDASKRLSRLIDDLLAYARAGITPIPADPVDCNALLDQVLTALQSRIEEAGARIEREHLPEVRGARPLLVQLFQNLIENALKFHGERPPRITITASSSPSEWHFTITDMGIGIEPQHLPTLFEPFRRIHPPSKFSGSGLGLAVCRRVVERHGGRIWAESRPGEGARFHFTLRR